MASNVVLVPYWDTVNTVVPPDKGLLSSPPLPSPPLPPPILSSPLLHPSPPRSSPTENQHKTQLTTEMLPFSEQRFIGFLRVPSQHVFPNRNQSMIQQQHKGYGKPICLRPASIPERYRHYFMFQSGWYHAWEYDELRPSDMLFESKTKHRFCAIANFQMVKVLMEFVPRVENNRVVITSDTILQEAATCFSSGYYPSPLWVSCSFRLPLNTTTPAPLKS